VSELGDTLRELVTQLEAHDRGRGRFGARQHDYRLRAPLAAGRLEAIEVAANVRFPDEYREHVLEADGGAGPYHGLMPLDHPLQLATARGTFDPAVPGPALHAGTIGLSHLGCGYVAFLVVRGEAAGQIWLDARGARGGPESAPARRSAGRGEERRASLYGARQRADALPGGGGVAPIFDGFRSFYLDWVHAMAHQELQRGFVTPGRCALPAALTSYLHAVEDRLGVARDGLPPDEVARALADIPDGGVAIAADGETPYFGRGELVDPCPLCAATAANLGLRAAQIEPGLPPIPLR